MNKKKPTQTLKEILKTIFYLRYQNKKFFLLKLFILGFLLFFIFDILDNLRYAKVVEPLIIKINGLSENDLGKIDLFRLGPVSGVTNITPDKNKNLKTIWLINNNYLKKVFLKIPVKKINHIETIFIYLGKKIYSYNNENLLEWNIADNKYFKKQNNDFIIYEFPDEIKTAKSNLPLFSEIINWKGFLYILLYSFLFSFIVFPLVFIIFPFDIYYSLLNKKDIK